MEKISAVNSGVFIPPAGLGNDRQSHGFVGYVRAAMELAKVRITVAVSLTTLTGFLFGSGLFSIVPVFAIVGIFLLACGSSVLNHIQERNTDAQMQRTQNRPLASGRVSLFFALGLAVSLGLAGTLLLAGGVNLTAALLGLFALLWYNGIYTPLKRVTAYAVIPGSLIGAIPPVVGWVAAGGSVTDFRILMVALFFFVWQIPHFWLLLLRYGPDYDRAGFPTLTRVHSRDQIERITMIWIWIMAVVALAIPVSGVTQSVFSAAGIGMASLWYVVSAFRILRGSTDGIAARRLFLKINVYALILMVVLSVDSYLMFS